LRISCHEVCKSEVSVVSTISGEATRDLLLTPDRPSTRRLERLADVESIGEESIARYANSEASADDVEAASATISLAPTRTQGSHEVNQR
jgi:hypothetical protein